MKAPNQEQAIKQALAQVTIRVGDTYSLAGWEVRVEQVDGRVERELRLPQLPPSAP